MAYRAIDIAKYVVTRCTIDLEPISNLQLQKILYYIQLNFIRKFKQLAFDDTIEAWQHGPVVPNIYKEFMREGSHKILEVYPKTVELFCDEQIKLINRITEKCRKLEPWELVARTHRPGSPWEQVYERGKKKEIPIQNIIQYALEK